MLKKEVELIMGEKRFELEYDKNCYKCIFDIKNKKLYSNRESICDLLNSLSEENEQLRKEKMEANDFIVEKGLEIEFIKWCRE